MARGPAAGRGLGPLGAGVPLVCFAVLCGCGCGFCFFLLAQNSEYFLLLLKINLLY